MQNLEEKMGVKFSLGHLEGWIANVVALHPEINTGDATLAHLKIVEEAYDRAVLAVDQKQERIQKALDILSQ